MKSLNSSTNGLVIGRTIILGPWQEHQKTLISNIVSTVCFYCWLYHVGFTMLIYWKMPIFEKKTRLVHESHAVKPTKKKTSPPATIPPFLLLLFDTKSLFQKQNEEKVMKKNNKHQHININYRHL